MKHIEYFIRCNGCRKESRRLLADRDFDFDKIERELTGLGWIIHGKAEGLRQNGGHLQSGYIVGGDFCSVDCFAKAIARALKGCIKK